MLEPSLAESFLSIIFILIAVAVVWIVLKLIFKITAKIFSCGCLVILIIGGLIFVGGSLGSALLP